MSKSKKKFNLFTFLWRITKLIIVLAFSVVTISASIRLASWFSFHPAGENSIDESRYIPLGGQEQFIRIRGKDTSNPVIIWLHGGPAQPDSYLNHEWQKYLLEDYTFIDWDQRGCGRTYYRNMEADPENESVTFEQLLSDLDELVDYARQRFGKDRVYILGHSFGSYLGIKYSAAHYEKVAKFVGVGHLVDRERFHISSSRGPSENGDYIHNAYYFYWDYVNDPSHENLLKMMDIYTPFLEGQKQKAHHKIGLLSPYMWRNDIRWVLLRHQSPEEYHTLNKNLFHELITLDSYTLPRIVKCKVAFITGWNDVATPILAIDRFSAKRWKKIIIEPSSPEERIGHYPQLTHPERFAETLREVLP